MNFDLFLKQKLSFWEHLTETQKELILQNTNIVHYKNQETVHSADEECVGVLIVKTGQLRTYILSEDGKEITLYRLNEGDLCILSASCLLKSITFDVHIDAQSDSDVFVINSEVFAKLLSQNIYVENFSLKSAVDRFSDVMHAMEQILFMSMEKRLAVFLLDEMSKTNSDTISLTHEQIAKYIGSAREVVSRYLKFFEKENLIELHRGYIKIVSKSKLKELI